MAAGRRLSRFAWVVVVVGTMSCTPGDREAELREHVGQLACTQSGRELGRIVDVERLSEVTFAYVVERDGTRRRVPPSQVVPAPGDQCAAGG